MSRANKIRKSESIILPDSLVQTLEQNGVTNIVSRKTQEHRMTRFAKIIDSPSRQRANGGIESKSSNLDSAKSRLVLT
jgi:protein-L-isoaspartate O-methyltransferase